MKTLGIAFYVEFRKAVASRVLYSTAIFVIVGITALAVTLTLSVNSGNERIVPQLGAVAQYTGWQLLFGLASQVTAAGGLLAIGIALSWIFGREFTDGTVSGLFALPVSRPTIAVAKLGIQLLWVLIVAICLSAALTVGGLTLNLGPLSGEVLQQLGRLIVLTVLTGFLAFPAAWAATLGRGPLAGLAITVAILVIAQVSAIAAPAHAVWFPLAVPVLWALEPETIRFSQLATVAVVPLIFGPLTIVSWQRLQLNR